MAVREAAAEPAGVRLKKSENRVGQGAHLHSGRVEVDGDLVLVVASGVDDEGGRHLPSVVGEENALALLERKAGDGAEAGSDQFLLHVLGHRARVWRVQSDAVFVFAGVEESAGARLDCVYNTRQEKIVFGHTHPGADDGALGQSLAGRHGSATRK